jgi:hypothetical protein
LRELKLEQQNIFSKKQNKILKKGVQKIALVLSMIVSGGDDARAML